MGVGDVQYVGIVEEVVVGTNLELGACSFDLQCAKQQCIVMFTKYGGRAEGAGKEVWGSTVGFEHVKF